MVSVNEIEKQKYDSGEEENKEIKGEEKINLELIEEKKFENESNSTNKLFDNLKDFVDIK